MRLPLPIATILAALLLFAAACDSQDATTDSVDTPAPSVTPLPTITSPPTSTPAPTLTPEPTPTEETPDFRPGPEDIITLLPYDAIKAILEPRFVDVEWAEQQMSDLEQVIGVSIGGEHRAYPIYMLSSREIVNDVVGGKPVAVTW